MTILTTWKIEETRKTCEIAPPPWPYSKMHSGCATMSIIWLYITPITIAPLHFLFLMLKYEFHFFLVKYPSNLYKDELFKRLQFCKKYFILFNTTLNLRKLSRWFKYWHKIMIGSVPMTGLFWFLLNEQSLVSVSNLVARAWLLCSD